MKIIHLKEKNLKKEELTPIKAVLDKGGVIAFPTETSYALGANPFNPQAVEKVFRLKKRASAKPLLLVIAEIEDLKKHKVKLPSIFFPLAEKFWPGPLTMVMKVGENFLSILKAGRESLGFRLSASLISREISRFCGFPITATSANISGGSNCLNAQQVIEEFGEGIDLLVDGGATPGGCSTVLDITIYPPKILRPGLISEEAIKQSLK